LGQIAATVTDAVDSRIFECLLPDDEELSSLVPRLVELLRYPLRGQDDYPLKYGFILKHGGLLPEKSALGELDLPATLTLRLAPELSAAVDPLPSKASSSPGQRTILSLIRIWDVTPADDIPEAAGFDIWIDSAARKQIESFARENAHIERAGLLLGHVSVHGNQRVAHITAAIPAKHAVGSRTNVRITLRAWEHVLGIRDSTYPDLRVLGWFHTHAGWGVFMSDSDVFIHSRFFSHPDMVSYVLDPTSERDAFFHWRKGHLAVIGSYGIAYSPDRQAKEAQEVTSGLDWRRPLKWVLGFIGAAVLVFGACAAVTWSIGGHNNPAANRKPAIVTAVKEDQETEMVYTITGAESLWRLCAQTYGDGSLARALARYNHLKSPDRLSVGQELRLPSREMLRSLE